MAIEEAQVLIWVVDARIGITQLDEELAGLLRATGKHVLVAANKTDSARLESESTEFYRFGFENVFPVSAEQGIGVGELLDGVVELLKTDDEQADERIAGEARAAVGDCWAAECRQVVTAQSNSRRRSRDCFAACRYDSRRDRHASSKRRNETFV